MRLAAIGWARELPSLRVLREWQPLERDGDHLILRWRRRWWGADESGTLLIAPDPRGARLHLEGSLKGWAGFILLGVLRWKTDGLLDRLVEDL